MNQRLSRIGSPCGTAIAAACLERSVTGNRARTPPQTWLTSPQPKGKRDLIYSVDRLFGEGDCSPSQKPGIRGPFGSSDGVPMLPSARLAKRQDLLPPDIYIPLVDSLYRDGRTLLTGTFFVVGSILTTYWKTGEPLLLACALAEIGRASCRERV